MCEQCAAMTIQGILCHETGCPEAWRDTQRSCRECEFDFTPEEQWQAYCEDCLMEELS